MISNRLGWSGYRCEVEGAIRHLAGEGVGEESLIVLVRLEFGEGELLEGGI